MASLWTTVRWNKDEGIDTGLLRVIEWRERAVHVELEDIGDTWLARTQVLNLDAISEDLGGEVPGEPKKIDTIVIRTTKAKELGLIDDEGD